MTGPRRSTLLSLVIGAAGALAAGGLGLPAPALLGSAIAVSIAALGGLNLEVPNRLRDLAFATIGCSLGTGFTPAFLDDLARWPASIAALCLSVALTMAAGAYVLVRYFEQEPAEAVLATSPGALSVTLSLATEGGLNVQTVMVLQTLRLLIITVSLPLILTIIGDPVPGSFSAQAAGIGYGVAALLLAVSLALGLTGTRMHVPAAYLLSGMAVSGGLHLVGVVEGRFPDILLFCGFLVTGSVVGARFSKIERGALRRLLRAALVTVGMGIAISAVVAGVAAPLLAMPFGQVWVSYAPGGVEAMAAMGLALGYDAAFIATHHLVRILLLIALLPGIVAFLRRG